MSTTIKEVFQKPRYTLGRYSTLNDAEQWKKDYENDIKSDYEIVKYKGKFWIIVVNVDEFLRLLKTKEL